MAEPSIEDAQRSDTQRSSRLLDAARRQTRNSQRTPRLYPRRDAILAKSLPRSPMVRTPNVEREVWSWLEEIMDPEIPVLSICDLGIVRNVRWEETELVVTITPTYSGCSTMAVITDEIRATLQKRGVTKV